MLGGHRIELGAYTRGPQGLLWIKGRELLDFQYHGAGLFPWVLGSFEEHFEGRRAIGGLCWSAYSSQGYDLRCTTRHWAEASVRGSHDMLQTAAPTASLRCTDSLSTASK